MVSAKVRPILEIKVKIVLNLICFELFSVHLKPNKREPTFDLRFGSDLD